MPKNKQKKIPLVIIFGRTNVGKSTLFNCLIENKQALVSPIEGTTRDSNTGIVSWRGTIFKIIDTGGIMDLDFLSPKFKEKKIPKIPRNITEIDEKVQAQARKYLNQADLILFLVDVRDGLLPQDKQMVSLLKKFLPNTKNVILIVNKADNPYLRKEIGDFYKLSLGKPYPISATTGSGTGDILDLIIKKIKAPAQEILTKKDEIRVCIIGKPNVGKSSLLNSLLGQERVIVSPIPHTTREPQDTKINYKKKPMRLIDTAGISRRGYKNLKHKTNKNLLESYGIAKSLSTLKKTSIALFIIDITKNITQQDAKIIEEFIKNKNSIIIIANKWDLIKDRDTKKFTEYIHTRLPFATWAPILFVSALTGAKIKKILDLILEIDAARKQKINTSQLNRFLRSALRLHRPTRGRGARYPYIYEIKQTKINPPQFTVQIGARDNLHHSYIRFLKNRLRDKFKFIGTPIGIYVEKRKKHENS